MSILIKNFSDLPNIPTESGSLLICQESALLSKLSFRHYVPTVAIATLPPALQLHADLQLHHLGGGLFLSCPQTYEYYLEKLSPLGATVIRGSTLLSCNYPYDIAYNIARVGLCAFHNTRFTDPCAKSYYHTENIPLIHVNQGYAKCLTAVTGRNSIITSDAGIHRAALSSGASSLLIEQGSISLPGYRYGFFGGSAALISKNKFFITGSLKNHPSGHKIYDFLEEQELEPVLASECAPVDIGSLIIA